MTPTPVPPRVPPSTSESDADLRSAVEEICGQICAVAAGNLDVRLDVKSADLSAQKLAMLGNAVLHVARRAIALSESSKRDLALAHEMARLGTWQAELHAGVESWTWSPELYRVLGLDPARGPAGREEYHALVHPADREEVEAAHRRARAGMAEAYEWRAVCPDGRERRIWTEVRPRQEGGAVHALHAVCQDVTERHAAEARIRYLAEHDGLTGLANRAVLRDRLEEVLKHRRRRRGQAAEVAVLCIDLDGFKEVNELHGHEAGDVLLMEAARRLSSLVRSGDTVARLGGDEFAIVQVGNEQPGAAEPLAARLVAALGLPYVSGKATIRNIGASIGVAVAPADGEAVDALLAAAGTALQRAKASGGRRSVYYHPAMEREARERRALEADLAAAVSQGEMSVAYQPLVDVGTRRVLGFEALLRWRHPARGMVPPDVFISVAEANGSIVALGEWALEQACAEAARWPVPLFVAVNVSPVQVQRGPVFAEMVERVLARTGLPPARLELEVTEGVLIRETDAALEALRRVRALGVRIALDDFGTGYSSLATLQAFPFDKIKVDRRFVAGLGGGSAQDATIVRAVLGLARGLGLPVVAEGVETEEQLEVLRAESCAEAQGWLFGRPGPAAAHLALEAPAAA
ncbi:putative bifunctional diguanylate cyclase/phosphodiesterase [Muricoccus nepalensis]|uniref:putative bifunctional diguanylate cyclase/phosphodiesterase n=1 Tax=Muricoccus nepalensis TaxID=1854500 RepID=UPI00138755B4|nr:GGDEF and EAL domain-containing protein [Roseomonas nepalensis]